MDVRTDIDHPQLGHLEYDEDLDLYSGTLSVDGGRAELFVHCFRASGEPPALGHAARIAAAIERLTAEAKERAVVDMLELKNGSWLDADEDAVSADEFKRRMRLDGVVVYDTGRAEFSFTDGDLFWGHAIMLLLEADGSWKKAHVAG